MAGWQSLQVVRKFEVDIYELGLEIVEPDRSEDQLIKLVPRGDCLPIYARDATIFCGSIEEAIIWMHGVRWARKYDDMIKISSDKTREKSEQKERNRQLMQSIESGRKVGGSVTDWSMPIMGEEDEDVPF